MTFLRVVSDEIYRVDVASKGTPLELLREGDTLVVGEKFRTADEGERHTGTQFYPGDKVTVCLKETPFRWMLVEVDMENRIYVDLPSYVIEYMKGYEDAASSLNPQGDSRDYKNGYTDWHEQEYGPNWWIQWGEYPERSK